jgi:Mn2+/Fe2+ NRAMP family transporter
MNSAPTGTAAGIDPASLTKDPPTTLIGILKSLGPGLIIAGSIVGSGELIATTSTGAEAGFSLLWLIIIGCVIKVFVQVELGRFTIVTGTTTISGLASLPGPRLAGTHLIVWYWFIMFIAIMGQLGGIVGGVGQALSISIPVTERGRTYNLYREAETQLTVIRGQWASDATDSATKQALVEQIAPLQTQSIDNYLLLSGTSRSQQEKDRLTSLRAQLASLSEASAGSTEHHLYSQILPRGDLANWVVAERALAADPNSADLKSNREKHRTSTLATWAKSGAADIEGGTATLDEYVTTLAIPVAKHRSDANTWTIILTIITIVLLVRGKYGFIQTFSTVLVGLFTLVTIVNVLGLQTISTASAWSITMADLREGLRFGLPPGDPIPALATALATFGIIGVGAAELIAYPYWCMEHGYARYAGPRDDSDAWAARARGWLRVLRWDAWCSMLVYTFATVAFYLLGAAILGRINLVPASDEMVRSLGVMYRPVFGETAEVLFLFGAFAVLYSTFFVATAGNSRMAADVFRVLKFNDPSEETYRRNVKMLCAVLPAICCITSVFGLKPVVMVLLSGTMQAIMLPMVAAAAIYFRYAKGDSRVSPGRAWDYFLIISAVGMLIAGVYAAYTKLAPYLP